MPFRLAPLKEALTPEIRWPESRLVWLLRAALAGLAAFSLFVEPAYTTRPLLVVSAACGLLASLAFAFVPTRRPRTLKGAEAGVLLAFAGHVVGHAFGLYQRFAWYDTALHFTVPLATVWVLYALSQATDWIWDWRRVKPLEVGIYLFSMSLALGTCWEILEFGMDRFAGTKEQDGLFDTMVDLIMDLLGALLGAVAAGLVQRHGRERGMDKVAEEPKRPLPSRAPHPAEGR